jgi:hypothetical protein
MRMGRFLNVYANIILANLYSVELYLCQELMRSAKYLLAFSVLVSRIQRPTEPNWTVELYGDWASALYQFIRT